MFKKRTFSEILEANINNREVEKKKKQVKEKAIKEDKQKRILDLVHLQYEKAQEIIGERFTLRQQHDTMFFFVFRGNKTSYQCKIYSHKLAPEGDFEFGDYSFSQAINSKLKKIESKNIKLYELANILIAWATIVLEEELSLMEK